MMSEQCKHKFRPRYNRKWSTALKDVIDSGRVSHAKHLNDSAYLQSEIYIYDICIKCGKIIKDTSNVQANACT